MKSFEAHSKHLYFTNQFLPFFYLLINISASLLIFYFHLLNNSSLFDERFEYNILEFASLIGLLLYSIWLSIKALVV
jgi:hypothetical protein